MKLIASSYGYLKVHSIVSSLSIYSKNS